MKQKRANFVTSKLRGRQMTRVDFLMVDPHERIGLLQS